MVSAVIVLKDFCYKYLLLIQVLLYVINLNKLSGLQQDCQERWSVFFTIYTFFFSKNIDVPILRAIFHITNLRHVEFSSPSLRLLTLTWLLRLLTLTFQALRSGAT